MRTVQNGAGHVRISRARTPFSLFRKTKRTGSRLVVLRTWWVSFSAPLQDGTRKQVKLSLKTDDRQEAARRGADLVLGRLNGTLYAPVNLELPGFLEEYKRHLYATKTKKTAYEEWSVLGRFFRATIPDQSSVPLRNVSTGMISTYLDRRRSEDGISEKTAYHIRQALHTMFNYAIRVRGFPTNPAHLVPKPKVHPGEIRFLRLPQVLDVLDSVRHEDPVLYGPVATAILAGLRRSEMVWLTWEDVNLERKRILIRFKTVHGERYKPKTNKSRIVPISEDLLPVLASLPRTSTWVFPSPEGERWNPENLTHRLQHFMGAHAWDYTFLVFRHTFGSQLAQKGMSLYKISALMGNSEKICREHYAALAVDELQADVSFLSRRGAPG